jgi:diaminopimelate decarboxylase
MTGNGHWWERDDLGYRDGRLHFGGRDLATFVASSGTPTYVYRAARVRDNLERLRGVLQAQGVEHDAFYAIAQTASAVRDLSQTARPLRHRRLLARRLRYARQLGFEARDLHTGANRVRIGPRLRLERHPGVHVNCDALSTIRRLGRRCPGRRIGIRLNPELGAGYNEHLQYAGEKPTKFGIYRDRFEEALATAREVGLRVETLHFHIGSGYLGNALEVFDQVLARVRALLDAHPEIRTVNVGGGLGVRLAEADVAIDLRRWAGIVARHLGALGGACRSSPATICGGRACSCVSTPSGTRPGNATLASMRVNIQNLAAYCHTSSPPLRSRHRPCRTRDPVGITTEDCRRRRCPRSRRVTSSRC